MDEQLNYLGAVLFWGYILAALIFTAIVLKTLYDMEPSEKTAKHAQTFGLLALVSFTTLSYNMLNVLVQSYTAWAHQRNTSLADTSLASIWHWSVTSTLFEDFGNAIMQDSARYLWVEAALLATMCVALFIGIEGRHERVPRLWAFVALSQILPISFTQNLFYVALLRQGPRQPRWVVARKVVVFFTGAYCACLIVAPVAAETPSVIHMIGMGRILLLSLETNAWANNAGSLPGNATSEADIYDRESLARYLTILSAVCAWGQLCLAFVQHTPVGIASALFAHPAVSSLGFDFLLCAISYLCWRRINLPSVKERSKQAN